MTSLRAFLHRSSRHGADLRGLTQRGATLVELLVVVAMMGVVTMGVTDLSLWVIKSNNASKFQQERIMQHEEIRQHLSVIGNCVATFGPLGNLNGPRVEANPQIRNADTTVAFPFNTPRGIGQVQITATEFRTFNTATTESAELRVTYSTRLSVTGPNQTSAEVGLIRVRIERDATGNLLRCLSEAMMSDGIWTRIGAAPANIVFSGGLAGVGVGTPADRFEVFSAAGSTEGATVRQGQDWLSMKPNAQAAGNWNPIVAAGDAVIASGSDVAAPTPRGLSLVPWSNTAGGLRIAPGGYVGVGLQNPPYQLSLSQDSASKPGTSTWIIASDERLKDVRAPFLRGLDAVLGLNTIYFNYKEDNPQNLPSNKQFVGIIAQDVQKVIPEAVSTDDQGYLHVTTDPIIWSAINAIKELYRKINASDSKFTNHERDIAALKADNTKLEQSLLRRERELEILKSRLDKLEKSVKSKRP